jgi:hypothetical protein
MDKYKVCQGEKWKDIYKKFYIKRGSFGKDGVFKILENHKLILNID